MIRKPDLQTHPHIPTSAYIIAQISFKTKCSNSNDELFYKQLLNNTIKPIDIRILEPIITFQNQQMFSFFAFHSCYGKLKKMMTDALMRRRKHVSFQHFLFEINGKLPGSRNTTATKHVGTETGKRPFVN